jgi:aspartate/methionine/tyrosine aminotransferase
LARAISAAYRAYLETHPHEWAHLAGMTPITISRFYRDRSGFAALERDVVPALVNNEATAQLDRTGVGYLLPEGAFYMWVDVRERCGDDVKQWALELLLERQVAVAPGTTFGAQGEGWIRISFATQTNDLLEGIERLDGV